MLTIHPGMPAISWVRCPRAKDFGWGLKVALSLGTRARALRVEAISWSNSGSTVVAKLMGSSRRSGPERYLRRGRLYHRDAWLGVPRRCKSRPQRTPRTRRAL